MNKYRMGEAVISSAPMPVAWERLQFINSELQMMLNLLTAEDSLRPGVTSPELIAVLMSYLEEVAALRSSGQLDEKGTLSDGVWCDYRASLERMRHIVPKMEQQLLNDRSRLAQEQSQIGRALAWNTTTKLTR
jgi:hypothetical protein